MLKRAVHLQGALWFPPNGDSIVVGCLNSGHALSEASVVSNRSAWDSDLATLILEALKMPPQQRMRQSANACIAVPAAETKGGELQHVAALVAAAHKAVLSGVAPSQIRLLSESAPHLSENAASAGLAHRCNATRIQALRWHHSLALLMFARLVQIPCCQGVGVLSLCDYGANDARAKSLSPFLPAGT